MQNRTLFFGDNLEILREKFPDKPDGDGYFDLIYLDPPFNSNRNYNVIFKEGLQDSPAQVHAFEDSWHWTHEAQATFEELIGVRQSITNNQYSVQFGISKLSSYLHLIKSGVNKSFQIRIDSSNFTNGYLSLLVKIQKVA